MSDHTTSPIRDLSFMVGQQPTLFTAFFNKHGFAPDPNKDMYEQWCDFSVYHILKTAVSKPNKVGAEIADAMTYCSNSYARSKDHGFWNTNKQQELAEQEKCFLTRILQELGTQHPSTSFPMNECYLEALEMWAQNNKKALNNLWSLMEHHGHIPTANNTKFHHIWEHIIRNGAVHEAQWLIAKGLLPTWRGTNHRYADQRNDDDTIFHLVKNKQNFSVIQLIPHDHLKPFAQMINGRGETSLHHAAKQLLPELVSLLLQLGVDPSIQNAKGQYPADMIRRTKSRSDQVGAVLELLGKQSTKTPEQLFVQACKSLDITTAQMAIDKGLDVKQMCTDTPRVADLVFERMNMTGMKQARTRQVIFLEFLINKGASLRNDQQQNALHLAIKQGAIQCVDLLLQTQPHLTQETDQFGRRPSQTPTEQIELEKATTMYVSPEQNQALLAKTQMNMFKIFLQHNIDVQQGDFPTARRHAEYDSKMTKLVLQRELGDTGHSKMRKKM